MPFTPSYHHRRSIRLPEYDYSNPGAYFVTLVAFQRQKIFGELRNAEVILSQIGKIVDSNLLFLPLRFPFLMLDSYVVMPDHLHAILIIKETLSTERMIHDRGLSESPKGTQPSSLASIIQNYKSTTSRKIHQAVPSSSTTIWQRNYYERIVRSERELNNIREYIHNNPFHPELEETGAGCEPS